jgi:hypothetical protein
LQAALPLAIAGVPPALYDRTISLGQHTSDVGNEGEEPLQAKSSFSVAEVVEEDSPNPPALVAPVSVHEVVIAPGLESRVELGMVPVAGRFQAAVKVDRVLRKRIRGGEIGSSPEPGIYRLA